MSYRGEMTESEVVRAYLDAWTSGDLAGAFAMYSDDFTLHYLGNNPLSGTHVGKDAALAALGTFTATTQRAMVGIDAVFGGDGYGGFIARERFHAAEDPADVRRVFLYRIQDDQLAECWVYDEQQALIDRLLSSPD